MEETLFLYIDILGFSNLIMNKKDVGQLYRIIDKAQIHHDSNFVTIVFSDTIIAYNKHRNLSNRSKATDLKQQK